MHRRRSLGIASALVALACALALIVPRAAAAQNATDNDVARARRLVNAGERAAAQSLAASMLEKYPEGTPEYADALYVRALSANSAAEAERDYLRVSLEYPLSPRAEDALMMVGQLRYARGERAAAKRAFERLVRDHPTGSQSAKASYWYGRLSLDDGDGANGCPALQRAKAQVSDDDVELRNQIDFHVRRCSTPGGIPVRDTTPPPAEKPGKGAKTTPTKPAPKAPAPVPRPMPGKPRPTLPADSVSTDTTVALPPRTARADSVIVDTTVAPPPVHPEPVRPAPERPPVATPPAKPAKEWTVQAAAFPKERDARALVEVLAQRGYQARVVGTKPPYRVRVGRWATREEADAALGGMRRMLKNGMVVEAEPQ